MSNCTIVCRPGEVSEVRPLGGRARHVIEALSGVAAKSLIMPRPYARVSAAQLDRPGQDTSLLMITSRYADEGYSPGRCLTGYGFAIRSPWPRLSVAKPVRPSAARPSRSTPTPGSGLHPDHTKIVEHCLGFRRTAIGLSVLAPTSRPLFHGCSPARRPDQGRPRSGTRCVCSHVFHCRSVNPNVV